MVLALSPGPPREQGRVASGALCRYQGGRRHYALRRVGWLWPSWRVHGGVLDAWPTALAAPGPGERSRSLLAQPEAVTPGLLPGQQAPPSSRAQRACEAVGSFITPGVRRGLSPPSQSTCLWAVWISWAPSGSGKCLRRERAPQRET